MAQAVAVGHDWRITSKDHHFTFARKWGCQRCGQSYKGEHPPQGVCAKPTMAYSANDFERVLRQLVRDGWLIPNIHTDEGGVVKKALEMLGQESS